MTEVLCAELIIRDPLGVFVANDQVVNVLQVRHSNRVPAVDVGDLGSQVKADQSLAKPAKTGYTGVIWS